MDKQSKIGFLLILLVFVAFYFLNKPNKAQIDAQKRYSDSIAAVQAAENASALKRQTAVKDSLSAKGFAADSSSEKQLESTYGNFSKSASGKETLYTLENNLLELKVSSKGGRVYSARLKNFKSKESDPLYLFNKDESSFGFTLVTSNNRVITTSDLYFDPVQSGPGKLVMKLKANDGSSLDFVYTLSPNDYMVRFDVVPENVAPNLALNTNSLDFQWAQKIPQQETGRKFEERYAYLMYKYDADKVEHLNAAKDESLDATGKVKWVGYKDQYFSTVLIADDPMESVTLDTKQMKEESDYLKSYTTKASVAFNPRGGETGFSIFFGPNDYSLLRKYDKTHFKGEDMQLEQLVPLGWSLFRAVNKWIVIPLFDFWTSIVGNIGLAILLLTLTVKIILAPVTFKTYMSSAKMKVLKPEIDEINAKYPAQEDALKKQQKMMELYKQAGVNPMGGCLPMLLQMPILFALFMFFPSAIELRHQSFLWAKDLATYDSIISWNANIPFVSSFYGNHVSLFCLLMTATTIIYTKFNMSQTANTSQQMPGMNLMMYGMPVFMMIFLNQYPAGLNYYYFLSSLITILITLVCRLFVDQKKVEAKITENRKKPAKAKKKSGFMARLEEAQRQQQALAKQRAKENQRKMRR